MNEEFSGYVDRALEDIGADIDGIEETIELLRRAMEKHNTEIALLKLKIFLITAGISGLVSAITNVILWKVMS